MVSVPSGHLEAFNARSASPTLLPASCFLLPASCFLLPASCFLFLLPTFESPPAGSPHHHAAARTHRNEPHPRSSPPGRGRRYPSATGRRVPRGLTLSRHCASIPAPAPRH